MAGFMSMTWSSCWMYVAGLLSVNMKVLGEPIVMPREGATFFREFTNSLAIASSLLLNTIAHFWQLPTLKLFHFLKAVPQSALSSWYVALLDPDPKICSGSRILDLNCIRSLENLRFQACNSSTISCLEESLSANLVSVAALTSGPCLVYSPMVFMSWKLALCSSLSPVMKQSSGTR